MAECGWYPVNSNIPLDAQIQVTMTKNNIKVESPTGIVIPFTATPNCVELDETLPTHEIQYIVRASTAVK